MVFIYRFTVNGRRSVVILNPRLMNTEPRVVIVANVKRSVNIRPSLYVIFWKRGIVKL
jgi:hypothetical protein